MKVPLVDWPIDDPYEVVLAVLFAGIFLPVLLVFSMFYLPWFVVYRSIGLAIRGIQHLSGRTESARP